MSKVLSNPMAVTTSQLTYHNITPDPIWSAVIATLASEQMVAMVSRRLATTGALGVHF